MKQLLLIIFFLCAQAFAGSPEINTYGPGGGFFSDPPRTDLAIKGYDTVAYFLEGKPVPGKAEFAHIWKKAKWLFASKENLEKFKATPEKWAPQYGGYCAYGVAQGNLVKIEPDQFAVLDGKLYLNYDADVSKKWNKDRSGFIKTANERFNALLHE